MECISVPTIFKDCHFRDWVPYRYSRMLYIISGGFIRTRFYANHIGRMPVSSFDSDSVYLKLFGTILSKCVPLSHGWFSN